MSCNHSEPSFVDNERKSVDTNEGEESSDIVEFI